MVGVMMGVMNTTAERRNHGSPSPKGVPGGSTAVFTMKEAAAVAGVSVSTLRRRRSDLEAAGATIEPGGWQVPVTALIATGLMKGEGSRPAPAVPESVTASTHSGEDISRLLERLRELESEVQEWRRRAEVAEARAEERERALDSLRVANEAERMALRMLTSQAPPAAAAPMPAPQEPAAAEPAPQPETPAQPAPRSAQQPQQPSRGFFSRLFNNDR